MKTLIRVYDLASGRRMGIFETGDMVGLDVTCGALTAIYEETKDPRWFPPAILQTQSHGRTPGSEDGQRLVRIRP